MTDDRRRQRASRRLADRAARYRAVAGGGDAMTWASSSTREARPNVLSNETIPNTLSGVGAPRPVARGGSTLLTLAGGLVVALVAALVILLLR